MAGAVCKQAIIPSKQKKMDKRVVSLIGALLMWSLKGRSIVPRRNIRPRRNSFWSSASSTRQHVVGAAKLPDAPSAKTHGEKQKPHTGHKPNRHIPPTERINRSRRRISLPQHHQRKPALCGQVDHPQSGTMRIKEFRERGNHQTRANEVSKQRCKQNKTSRDAERGPMKNAALDQPRRARHFRAREKMLGHILAGQGFRSAEGIERGRDSRFR